MTVAKHMKVNLFASEQECPDLVNPVQMQWDTKGRLWVAVWSSYPHWKPKDELNDKILIFEDTKGTGKADKCTVFADHLTCPTGFAFYDGGILSAQAPDVMFLKANDGGDKADIRIRVVDGMDSADTHHTCNSFAIDPGGAVYWQEGTFHHTQVETPWGPPVRNANAGVYRYEPRTQSSSVYVAYNFANPHGHVWDRWGEDYVFDGTGANPYNGSLFSGHIDFPTSTRIRRRSISSAGGLVPARNPVAVALPRREPRQSAGGQCHRLPGHFAVQAAGDGPSLTATEVEPILSSTDTEFPSRATSKWARTAPSISATGRTRSSATCSTTSAIPAATRPTAASIASSMKAFLS